MSKAVILLHKSLNGQRRWLATITLCANALGKDEDNSSVITIEERLFVPRDEMQNA